MSEKRIDDSKLGGISGGSEHIKPEGPGSGPTLGRSGGSVPIIPTPVEDGPTADGQTGQGNSNPFAK